MRTMTTLRSMAIELAEIVDSALDDEKRADVAEFLSVGEEGLAVDWSLEAANKASLPIPVGLWHELHEYFAPHTLEASKYTLQLLDEAKRAA